MHRIPRWIPKRIHVQSLRIPKGEGLVLTEWESLFRLGKESSWNPAAIWLNLFNWLPLFIAFSGFQKYLSTEKQRMRFAQCLILGLIPLLISIFETLSLDPRLEHAIIIFLFFLVKSRISLLRFS